MHHYSRVELMKALGAIGNTMPFEDQLDEYTSTDGSYNPPTKKNVMLLQNRANLNRMMTFAYQSQEQLERLPHLSQALSYPSNPNKAHLPTDLIGLIDDYASECSQLPYPDENLERQLSNFYAKKNLGRP